MELWAPVEDYPNYIVSNEGAIRSELTGREMHARPNQTGVMNVSLENEFGRTTRSLAVVVASAHCKRQPYPHFNTVIHLDGDRRNCHADNLDWRPRWFAIQFHKQFLRLPYVDTQPFVEMHTGEVYRSPLHAAIAHGLLEAQVIGSFANGEPVSMTGDQFDRANY